MQRAARHDLLLTGRQALAEAEWEKARESFERALELGEGPDAMDGLAQALQWLGHYHAAIAMREAAFAAYRRQGAGAGGLRAGTSACVPPRGGPPTGTRGPALAWRPSRSRGATPGWRRTWSSAASRARTAPTRRVPHRRPAPRRRARPWAANCRQRDPRPPPPACRRVRQRAGTRVSGVRGRSRPERRGRWPGGRRPRASRRTRTRIGIPTDAGRRGAGDPGRRPQPNGGAT